MKIHRNSSRIKGDRVGTDPPGSSLSLGVSLGYCLRAFILAHRAPFVTWPRAGLLLKSKQVIDPTSVLYVHLMT